MTAVFILQLCLFFALLIGLSVPLGNYIGRVYLGEAAFAQRLVGPAERGLYRLAGIDPTAEMNWKGYAWALALFNGLGMAVVFGLQMVQGQLPWNPSGVGAVPPEVAFNTAVSFATNTNWQAYSGEATMSHLTQMLGLTVQNFLSAATGMAVAAALVRGFVRKNQGKVGNFWVDVTRGTLYVLLPLSLLLAIGLVSQGVVQTLAGSAEVEVLDRPGSGTEAGTEARTEGTEGWQAGTERGWQAGTEAESGGLQRVAMGPAASQVAIKELGTNGGGFFNANSAHPLENPTPLSNYMQLLAMLLIPAAMCFAFGRMVHAKRQAWVLLAAMMLLLVPAILLTAGFEASPNPALAGLGIDPSAGSLEGKEVRFGADASALWASVTTASSNGSVNAMHDSFTPLGGLMPMWLMQTGEVAFGGVGSGLYGMLVFAILAVFIAGLMVGRTPELLGKKMEAFEMKMACLAVLLPSAAVLLGTGVACLLPTAGEAVSNPGAHGFSEILYAFSSGANNNGSAFGGLDGTSLFYTLGLGIAMLVGRFGVIVPVLAIAGSLAAKKSVPVTVGTLPTQTVMFVFLLVGTVALVGALTFIPALALGPIAEHLQTFARVWSAP